MPVAPSPILASEHGPLLAACEQLVADMEVGTARLVHGRRADSRHYDYVDRMDLLAANLRAVLDLVALNDYPASFALLRTALEHHLLDRLVFLATRLQYRYRVKAADVPAEEGRLRTLRSTTRPDIVRWRVAGREFTVIISGIHETGRIGKPPTISPYWAMLEQYDPFAGRRSLQSRLSHGFWPRKLHKKAADDAWALWSTRFAPDAMTRSLLTNRLLTVEQSVQLGVHYSFLSAFAHPSRRAADLALGRNRPRRVRAYDHYCAELALLYVAVLAAEELRAFARACRRRPACGLAGWARVEADMATAAAESDRLWFLTGGPGDLDRFHEANSRMSATRRRSGAIVPIAPASLSPRHVHYYRNPLVRIVEMHHDINELSTGLRYVSPTPRPDAWNRI